MTRVRVKICGIRNPADGVAAVEAGADYIGVVFAERVRRVTVEQAAGIVTALSGRATGVGVFVDATQDDVLACRDAVGFEVAQLHGSETPEVCRRVRKGGVQVWKAIRPRSPEELVQGVDRYGPGVDALLIEGFSVAAAGGTGTSFPHEWLTGIDRRTAPDIVLAGGLSASNVGMAVETVAPDIVDVSSGVETTPGVKSIPLIEEFMEAVRAVGAAACRGGE